MFNENHSWPRGGLINDILHAGDNQFSTSWTKGWEERSYEVRSDHTINKFAVSMTSQLSPVWCKAHYIAQK